MPKEDVFPNRALAGLTMTGANAISFEQIRFQTGIFEGKAVLLHKIEYHLSNASYGELVADSDWVMMGLTLRDDLTSLLPTHQAVLDSKGFYTTIVGTVVGIQVSPFVIETNFTDMPGKGLIIPANPLYLAMHSAGFTGAGVCRVVIYFTFRTLTDKDYLELLQTMVPANV